MASAGLKCREVLVFGNPLVESDSIALKVADRLQGKLEGFEFRRVESLSDAQPLRGECIVLDAARGIKKVGVIKDLGAIESRGAFSSHDLDLGFEIRLLRKLGKIKKVKVVGIPAGCPVEKAAEEVGACLASLGE